MDTTITVNGRPFAIGGLTAAEAERLAAEMERLAILERAAAPLRRAVMDAADYLDELAAGQAAAVAAQPGGGPAVHLHCARCDSTGMIRDQYPGLPDCWAPCPDCDDERSAIAASLATIAPAFRRQA